MGLGKDEGVIHCSHVNKYGMTTWLHCSSVLSFLIAKTKIAIKKSCALLAMQLKTNVKMSEHFKKIKPTDKSNTIQVQPCNPTIFPSTTQ